jgi:leader peptidase (prepilin peptidase)/N-methyltransferase
MSAFGLAGAGWLIGPTALFPAYAVYVGLCTVLMVTDLDQKLIPNRVLYPWGSVVAGLMLVGAAILGTWEFLGRGALAGVGYFAGLFIVATITRGFGFGDVKLATVIGLVVGYWGWRVFAQSLFLTGLIGGIPALVMLATRRVGRRDELPYGPAMILGSWAGLAVGLTGGGLL